MAARSASSARPANPAVAPDGAAATLVVGLGNPLRGDDGVGWRVVDALRHALARGDDGCAGIGPVELEQLAVGGITLMEHLVGYRRAVLVDAVSGGVDPVGTVAARPLAAVASRAAAHLDSAHDATLAAALAAGEALGADLPTDIVAVTVEIVPDDRFSNGLTPPVAAAVDPAVKLVLAACDATAGAASPG